MEPEELPAPPVAAGGCGELDAEVATAKSAAAEMATRAAQRLDIWMQEAKELQRINDSTPQLRATQASAMRTIGSHFDLPGRSIDPADPIGSLGPFVSLLDALGRRYRGVQAAGLSFNCEPTCPSDRGEKGGHSVPGSGVFTICTDVFSRMDAEGQAYLALHESFHARFEEVSSSGVEVYHNEKGYPPRAGEDMRTADAYATLAYVLTHQGVLPPNPDVNFDDAVNVVGEKKGGPGRRKKRASPGEGP